MLGRELLLEIELLLLLLRGHRASLLLSRTLLPVGHILETESAHGLLRVVSTGPGVSWDNHLACLLREETGFLIVPNAFHIRKDLVILHALLLAKLAHHALVHLPLLQ